MKNILLLSLTTLLSFNALADYKVYGSQKNSLPIPKERPLFEKKISFENGEDRSNVTTSGHFSIRNSVNNGYGEKLPTDGEKIGVVMSQPLFQPFYGYIEIELPEYVNKFDISFDYLPRSGTANGVNMSEFVIQGKSDNGSYTDLTNLSVNSIYMRTYSGTYNKNYNTYRIKMRIGTNSSRFGSNQSVGIDNIQIKEIKIE